MNDIFQEIDENKHEAEIIRPPDELKHPKKHKGGSANVLKFFLHSSEFLGGWHRQRHETLEKKHDVKPYYSLAPLIKPS